LLIKWLDNVLYYGVFKIFRDENEFTSNFLKILGDTKKKKALVGGGNLSNWTKWIVKNSVSATDLRQKA